MWGSKSYNKNICFILSGSNIEHLSHVCSVHIIIHVQKVQETKDNTDFSDEVTNQSLSIIVMS